MKMVVIPPLLAMSALCSMAAPPPEKAPLAIYYSFDSQPSAALMKEMQAELGRILAPSGMWATWLPLDNSRQINDDFPGIVVFRFAGHCSFDDLTNDARDPAGKALADTDTENGHVLPFSRVDCERVRTLIAPNMKGMPPDWKNQNLGRALARVAAHEIYHVLTGVEEHANNGIFQSADSREDLTAATFSFAGRENAWLRHWLERQEPGDSSEPASSDESATTDVSAGR